MPASGCRRWRFPDPISNRSAPHRGRPTPFGARLREGEITLQLLGVLRDVADDEQAVANGSVAVEEMPPTLSAPIRLSFAPAPARASASIPTKCWVNWVTAARRSKGCAPPARWGD